MRGLLADVLLRICSCNLNRASLVAQMFQRALMVELQGLQGIHVTVANQLTRLKVREGHTKCFTASVGYFAGAHKLTCDAAV